MLDPTSDSNRTGTSSEDLENSAFHQDVIVDHRLNLSDMESQFPAVNMQNNVLTDCFPALLL